MDPHLPALAFIAFLLLQRGTELVIARRNTRRLLARGAVEHGAGHYPLIVAMHAAWLLAIAVLGWSSGTVLYFVVAALVVVLAGETWAVLKARTPYVEPTVP